MITLAVDGEADVVVQICTPLVVSASRRHPVVPVLDTHQATDIAIAVMVVAGASSRALAAISPVSCNIRLTSAASHDLTASGSPCYS